MFGELIFLVAFSLCCFLRLSLDKPKFVVAGRRPEVESARSSGGGSRGGQSPPLEPVPLSLSPSPATPSRPRILSLFLSLPLLSLVSLDLFNAAGS